MTFRDHGNAQRERFEGLAHDISGLRASVTEAFWRVLPRDAAMELEALHRAMESVAATGTFHEQLAARERHRDLLAHWVDRIDDLERAGATLPETARIPELFAALPHPLFDHVFGRVRRRAEAFRRAISSLDPNAGLQRRGAIAMAQLRIGRDPFAITGGLAETEGDGGPVFAMTTSTSLLTAPLLLVPISIATGIFIDAEPDAWHPTGDAAFDTRYHVRASVDAVRILLGPEARASLLSMPSIPSLTVDPGRARIQWRSAPTADVFSAAARTLAAIRHAPPTLRLRA